MIEGSIVALVTPMSASGDIDWDSLARLVDWHVEQNTNAIVAMGTTGESATLDFKEHTQVVAFVVKQSAGRIPVIAGTGANATSEAIRLTKEAKEVGADACLLVTPYYNKPTQAGLVAHYTAIADAVDIPQILYNVPGRTACDMLPSTVLKLSVHKNIIGIKEASGNLDHTRDILAQADKGFFVYSGDDASAMESMLMGGKGNISVTANIVPRKMSDLCRLSMAGDREAASKINEKLAAVNQLLFIEANPIPVKWAMYRMGLIEEGIRLPLTALSSQCQPKLEAALSELGLLSEALVD